MSTRYPTIPNYGAFAFSLSLKAPKVKQEIFRNRVTIATASINPALLAACLIVLYPVFDAMLPEWLCLPAFLVLYAVVFYKIYDKKFLPTLSASIERNHSVLLDAISKENIGVFADLVSEVALSKHKTATWRVDAESIRKSDPYLYCATVFARNFELWDLSAEFLYKRLIDCAEEIA